jgi:tetratricopeptide (TPR) repeat protein
MIDVDHMEDQLQSASKGRGRSSKPLEAAASRPVRTASASRLAPPSIAPALAAASGRVLARLRAPVPAPEPAGGWDAWPARRRASSRLVELVEDGELSEADALMAGGSNPRETVSWATMRALLEGREATARAQNRAMRNLAKDDRDPDATDRYWLQRFWLVMAWGSDDERHELAGHCRDRAYRADDLQWTAALALLAAQMGHADEAREAFEDAFGRLGRADESIQLDVATNLVDAAAFLRDASLAARLHYTLVWIPGRLVSVGEGWICKGAIERFKALGEAAVGLFDEADEDFGRAVARHRALDAAPLLAQTLHQWGITLVGRDDGQAAECFREADALVAETGQHPWR